jgi:hypothetical protein
MAGANGSVRARVPTRRAERLADALAAYEPVLRNRIESAAAGEEAWARTSVALLAKTKDALARGRINEGWACLQEAQRHELTGMTAAEQLARAQSVLHEATADGKLADWRRRCVETLLAPTRAAPPEIVPVTDLREATRMLHEQFQDDQGRVEMLRGQLLVAGLVVAVIVGIILVIAYRVGFEGGRAYWDLVIVTVAGSLGGAGSAVVATARGGPTQRVPEYLNWAPMMLIRPVFGAAAAIVIYFFMRGGVLPGAADNLWSLSATAFVAGFSERWFLGVVGAFQAKQSG